MNLKSIFGDDNAKLIKKYKVLVDKINEMIKDGEPIKIVIIDSLTAHFRAEFTGRGELADRQHKLNKYLRQ